MTYVSGRGGSISCASIFPMAPAGPSASVHSSVKNGGSSCRSAAQECHASGATSRPRHRGNTRCWCWWRCCCQSRLQQSGHDGFQSVAAFLTVSYPLLLSLTWEFQDCFYTNSSNVWSSLKSSFRWTRRTFQKYILFLYFLKGGLSFEQRCHLGYWTSSRR